MNTFVTSPISKAMQLVEEYNLTIPVDVEGLCKKNNIKLLYANFEEIETAVGKKISGLIHKDTNGTVIWVNENDIYTRGRFTIAHELGHYYLHMPKNGETVITSFRMDRSPRETEANSFASELLMPYKRIKEEYGKLIIPVCDDLAKTFQVSRQAMEIRLERLGLMYV